MKKMVPQLNYVKLYSRKEYRGQFVALQPGSLKVVGYGPTPEKAEKQAANAGTEKPIITRVPSASAAYLIL